jgi:hypothetical protein
MKLLRNLLLKLCFKIINKYLKTNNMSKNIDNLITSKILPVLNATIIPTLTVSSNTLYEKIYLLEFTQTEKISFTIEYNPNKRLSFYLNECNIKHLENAAKILENLINLLNTNYSEIAAYFEIELIKIKKNVL